MQVNMEVIVACATPSSSYFLPYLGVLSVVNKGKWGSNCFFKAREKRGVCFVSCVKCYYRLEEGRKGSHKEERKT